ncbi:MAG: hypothetical protein ACOC0F_03080 [archaeon]
MTMDAERFRLVWTPGAPGDGVAGVTEPHFHANPLDRPGRSGRNDPRTYWDSPSNEAK